MEHNGKPVDLQKAYNDRINRRTSDLVDQYDDEFRKLVDGKIVLTLTNDEYAARTAALLISLNRQLSRAAAAFAGSNGVSDEEMLAMVMAQFTSNFAKATAAAAPNSILANEGSVQ
jgi:hypothetical protein